MKPDLRYEGEERTALQRLFRSEGWKLLVKEVEELLQKNRELAMDEFDRDIMVRRQGYDLAIRKFLSLPDMMLETERLQQFARIEDLSHLREPGDADARRARSSAH